MVIPRYFISFGATGNDFGGQFLLANQTADLTGAQNTILKCARPCFARSSEPAAVIHAVLVGDCIATTIVGDAHVNLFRVDVVEPEKFQCVVNLLQIRMRLDIRTQTRNVHIPWPMKVVREYGKPIDLRFE